MTVPKTLDGKKGGDFAISLAFLPENAAAIWRQNVDT
jgi:hypothetical protein